MEASIKITKTFGEDPQKEVDEVLDKGFDVTTSIAELIIVIFATILICVTQIPMGLISLALGVIYNRDNCGEGNEYYLIILGVIDSIIWIFAIVRMLERLCINFVRVPSIIAFGVSNPTKSFTTAIDIMLEIPIIILEFGVFVMLIILSVKIGDYDKDKNDCPDAIYDGVLTFLIVRWLLALVQFAALVIFCGLGGHCCILSCGVMSFFSLSRKESKTFEVVDVDAPKESV